MGEIVECLDGAVQTELHETGAVETVFVLTAFQDGVVLVLSPSDIGLHGDHPECRIRFGHHLGVPHPAHAAVPVVEGVDGFDVEMGDSPQDRFGQIGSGAPVEQPLDHRRHLGMVRGLVDQSVVLEYPHSDLSESRLLHQSEHQDIERFQEIIDGPCPPSVESSVCDDSVLNLEDLVEGAEHILPVDQIDHLQRSHAVPFDG